MQYVGVITNVNDLAQDTTGGLTMKILIIEQNWTALNMFDVRKYIFWVGNLCDLLHVRIYANSGLHLMKKISSSIAMTDFRYETVFSKNCSSRRNLFYDYGISLQYESLPTFFEKNSFRCLKIFIIWFKLPLLYDLDV